MGALRRELWGQTAPVARRSVVVPRPPRIEPVPNGVGIALDPRLRRAHPLNFHDGMEVAVPRFDFRFQLPKLLPLELQLGNQRYRPRTVNVLCLTFDGVELQTGRNELLLCLPGCPTERRFLITYRFESAPYFGRRDPLTREHFATHHDVVRCHECAQYSLRSSWSSASGPCPFAELGVMSCNNTEKGFLGPSDLAFWDRDR